MPESLEPQPVVGDEILELQPGRKTQPLDLGAEPGMDSLRQLVEVRPRRDGAGVELTRAERLQERLAERAADPHRLADRLHLRPAGPICAGELFERETRRLADAVDEG